MKKKLTEAFPEIELFDIAGALKKQNIAFDKTETGVTHIVCCGEPVTFYEMLGDVDYVYCEKCGKGIQTLLGFQQVTNFSGGYLDSSKYDLSDNRYWYTIDVNIS
jgi:hypothetical protein